MTACRVVRSAGRRLPWAASHASSNAVNNTGSSLDESMSRTTPRATITSASLGVTARSKASRNGCSNSTSRVLPKTCHDRERASQADTEAVWGACRRTRRAGDSRTRQRLESLAVVVPLVRCGSTREPAARHESRLTLSRRQRVVHLAGAPPPHPPASAQRWPWKCGRGSWSSPRVVTQRASGPERPVKAQALWVASPDLDGSAQAPQRASLPTRGDDHSEPELWLGASPAGCLTNCLTMAAPGSGPGRTLTYSWWASRGPHAGALGRVHTEEVTGSNPLSPTHPRGMFALGMRTGRKPNCVTSTGRSSGTKSWSMTVAPA